MFYYSKNSGKPRKQATLFLVLPIPKRKRDIPLPTRKQDPEKPAQLPVSLSSGRLPPETGCLGAACCLPHSAHSPPSGRRGRPSCPELPLTPPVYVCTLHPSPQRQHVDLGEGQALFPQTTTATAHPANLPYYKPVIFMAALGLCCCSRAFSSCGERGLLFVVVCGLLIGWFLLLRSTGSRHTGSVVLAHGLSCSAACGVFPHQGSNPCPLHWQADS